MWKKEFDTSYVGFMKDGAQWLVDNTDIKLVGKLGPFLLEGHSWSSNNLSIDLFLKKNIGLVKKALANIMKFVGIGYCLCKLRIILIDKH